MLKLLSSENNKNYYSIDTIKDVYNSITSSDKNTFFYYKDYTINIYRTKNDINGNPLYKLFLYKNNINIAENLKGLVKRVNNNKGYGLIQSYNIKDSLNHIFDNL